MSQNSSLSYCRLSYYIQYNIYDIDIIGLTERGKGGGGWTALEKI